MSLTAPRLQRRLPGERRGPCRGQTAKSESVSSPSVGTQTWQIVFHQRFFQRKQKSSHIYVEDFPLTIEERQLINFCLFQAERAIALKWKETHRAASGQRITELSSDLAKKKNDSRCKRHFFLNISQFAVFPNLHEQLQRANARI